MSQNKIPLGQNVTGQNATRTKCHRDKMSHGQNATEIKCHMDKMSLGQNVTGQNVTRT